MSLALLVTTVLVLFRLVKGEPSWTFKTNQLIFGKNFKLSCTFANDTEIIDQATKPSVYVVDLRLKDGELSNNSKTIDKADRTSEYTMKSYNEHGVSIPYNCQHGNTKYLHTYRITVDNVQYHPYTDNESHDELFSIRFENIMASPECTAIYRNKDLTKELKTTQDKKTPVYNVTIRLPYHTSPKCSDSLKVVCQVDKNKIEHSIKTIDTKCLPKSPEKTEKPGQKEKDQTLGQIEKDQALGIVGLVVFSIIAVIYIAGMIGCIYLVRKNNPKKKYIYS